MKTESPYPRNMCPKCETLLRTEALRCPNCGFILTSKGRLSTGCLVALTIGVGYPALVFGTCLVTIIFSMSAQPGQEPYWQNFLLLIIFGVPAVIVVLIVRNILRKRQP